MIEIERRFLVAEAPPDLPVPTVIEQAYLSTGPPSVRVRRAGDRFVLTIKTGTGLVRHEIERDLDADEFAVLWEVATELRIAKRRFHVDVGDGLVAEYDEFDGHLAGHRLVEVEFPDVETSRAFVAPPWFGTEVTDDPRYTNRTIARDGWPT